MRPPRGLAPDTCRTPDARCRAPARRARCCRISGSDWADGWDCGCVAACDDVGHRRRRHHCGRHATAADCLVSLTWASYTPDGFVFATLCPLAGAVTAQWCEGYLALGETPGSGHAPQGANRKVVSILQIANLLMLLIVCGDDTLDTAQILPRTKRGQAGSRKNLRYFRGLPLPRFDHEVASWDEQFGRRGGNGAVGLETVGTAIERELRLERHLRHQAFQCRALDI